VAGMKKAKWPRRTDKKTNAKKYNKNSTYNIVCEYEVNLSTNEKVITEKQNNNTNC